MECTGMMRRDCVGYFLVVWMVPNLFFFCSFEGPVLRAAFGMTPSRELGCTVMGDVDECDVGTILWF
jgi:hypothetical protein